jgi:hypothetical protein
MHKQTCRLPFQQTPTNFKEEERLLRRLYRLTACLENMEWALQETRPRLARDLSGLLGILECYTCGIEGQLSRPGRCRTRADEALAKRPFPTVPLLVHLLAIARKAASEVLKAHNATVEREESQEACSCCLCADILSLRWLLGTVRRLIAARLGKVARPTPMALANVLTWAVKLSTRVRWPRTWSSADWTCLTPDASNSTIQVASGVP